MIQSKKLKTFFAIIILAGLASAAAYGQCSDAGVCIIGAKRMKGEHRLGAAYSYGRGDKRDGTSFHSLVIDAEIRLVPGTDLVVRMPFTAVRGPLGSVTGPGDLMVLINRRVFETAAGLLKIQAGGKFPTGESNGGGLPQSYQPGLGTTDLLVGSSFESGPLLVAVGYQLSRGRSENTATRLKRGDDLFSRVGLRTTVEGTTVGAELLAIKRLHLSSILDPAAAAGTENFISVPGSDQFQMNLITTAVVPLQGDFSLAAKGAFALLKRDVNVDGLTRGLTLSLGVQYAP